MKMKGAVKIQTDLLIAGIPQKDAVLLAKAAGLDGQAANAFHYQTYAGEP